MAAIVGMRSSGRTPTDEWAVGRRYMSLESLAPVSDTPIVRLPGVAACRGLSQFLCQESASRPDNLQDNDAVPSIGRAHTATARRSAAWLENRSAAACRPQRGAWISGLYATTHSPF